MKIEIVKILQMSEGIGHEVWEALNRDKKLWSIPVADAIRGFCKHHRDASGNRDLVLDRADRTVDLCEMKFSEEPYEINKNEYERLRNRRAVYQREARGKKNCRTTFVMSSGIRPGKYRGVVQAEVNLDDLFA